MVIGAPWYRRSRLLVATPALLGALVGCGPLGRGGPETAVTFENQALDVASVYAIGTSGEPYRIGTVAGGRTERLRLPAALVSSGTTVNFVARPLATSRLATSGPVSIRPGEGVRLTLPPAENTLSVLPGGP
jgi:hypothetical protein